MRVLHVVHTTELGLGVSVDLARDQAARGWDVALACSPDAAAESWRGGPVRQIAWPATRQPGPATAGEIRRLARIVRDVRPDLLHLHSSKAGLAGRLVARGRTPTVFQPHAWSFEATGGAVGRAALEWERRGARWAHVLLCVSEAERRTGERAGVEGTYRVVPNGVDTDAVAPASAADRTAARAELGLPDGPLVVCVGRLIRQKGQDVLLDAWPRVRAAVPDAELALVGDGPDREALERRAVGGVRFAGYRSDVRRWLAAADVVAQPSRFEGMSLVVMEAMATARSVVAADAEGMRESLGPDAGAIVPVEDAEALAAAIVERLRDPALADVEGKAGRRRAEEELSIRRTRDGVAAVYVEILGGR